MRKKDVTDLSYRIVGCAIKVHEEIGAGLLESIYEECLRYQLRKDGFEVRQQVTVPVIYDELVLNTNFRLDLLVNDLIIVEVKAVKEILPVHKAQLLTYMKLLKKPQGLILNFYTDNITDAMLPMVNDFFYALPD